MKFARSRITQISIYFIFNNGTLAIISFSECHHPFAGANSCQKTFNNFIILPRCTGTQMFAQTLDEQREFGVRVVTRRWERLWSSLSIEQLASSDQNVPWISAPRWYHLSDFNLAVSQMYLNELLICLYFFYFRLSNRLTLCLPVQEIRTMQLEYECYFLLLECSLVLKWFYIIEWWKTTLLFGIPF